MDKIKALSKNHIDQNRVNREPSVLAWVLRQHATTQIEEGGPTYFL